MAGFEKALTEALERSGRLLGASPDAVLWALLGRTALSEVWGVRRDASIGDFVALRADGEGMIVASDLGNIEAVLTGRGLQRRVGIEIVGYLQVWS